MCGEILFQDFDHKPKITQDWNCRTTESQRLEGNARDHQVQPAAKPGTIHCNDNFILQVIEKLRKGAVLNLFLINKEVLVGMSSSRTVLVQ